MVVEDSKIFLVVVSEDFRVTVVDGTVLVSKVLVSLVDKVPSVEGTVNKVPFKEVSVISSGKVVVSNGIVKATSVEVSLSMKSLSSSSTVDSEPVVVIVVMSVDVMVIGTVVGAVNEVVISEDKVSDTVVISIRDVVISGYDVTTS